MSSAHEPLQIDGLQKRLRAKLRAADESFELQANEVASLLDELGRLQQSSDRLRRQNRRLRLRLQRAGIDDQDPEVEQP